MPDCIFCQIIKGEIPSYKIYEDKEFIAILDIFPKTQGHTLVIPKKHVPWVWDYPDLGKYFDVVGKIARHLRQVSGEAVVRSLVYGIDVPHAHIHLFPGIKDNLTGQKLSGEQMETFRQRFEVSK
jgi:histidine triad (HIT) family protein